MTQVAQNKFSVVNRRCHKKEEGFSHIKKKKKKKETHGLEMERLRQAAGAGELRVMHPDRYS